MLGCRSAGESVATLFAEDKVRADVIGVSLFSIREDPRHGVFSGLSEAVIAVT